jgi:leucyl aminopeptidase
LEVFRIIANSNLVPKRTIQFHAYAAEEMGLLGSRDISNKYKQTNVKVYGMMQLDMTAYNPRQSKIAIVTTSTSSLLNTFVRKLVAEYCKVPSVDRTLFGGTSDHASWTRNGYHAVFPFEVDMNPHIHTSRDTIDKLDLKFATEYVKLGIAFVVEMSLA